MRHSPFIFQAKRKAFAGFLCSFLVLAAASGLLALKPAPAWGYGRERIIIYGPGARKIPIAIQDFEYLGKGEDRQNLSAKLTAVMAKDLDLSSLFESRINPVTSPFPSRKTFERGPAINYTNWEKEGIDFLIKGGFWYIDNKIVVNIHLYDIVKREEVLFLPDLTHGKSISSSVGNYRKVIHKLAEEVFYTLVGDRGIFSTKIAFVLKGRRGKGIFMMDFDGSEMRRVTSGKYIDLSPAWSPDGRSLAFVSIKNQAVKTYLIDIFDSGKLKLFSAYQGVNSAPAWSPDGSCIAIVLTKDGNPEIYKKYLKGSRQLERLTSNIATDTEPCWSPDGEKIAFVSDRSGSPQIYIMNEDGSDVRQLTFEGDFNASPAWSPRGDKIAFVGMKDSRFDIYTINVDGTDLRNLTNGVGSNESPTWSPDGRLIAFSSDREGGISQIYIMEPDGSNVKRLTDTNQDLSDPAWSPRLGF